MNPRHILIFLLTLFALVGGVSGFFDARNLPEPTWWILTSTLFLSITIFYWYRLDSIQRSFKRSIWLNIGVVGLAPLAIPGYIFLRSERGARVRPFARMLGYMILLLVAVTAGGIVGGLAG
jgi:hypothetical protein